MSIKPILTHPNSHSYSKAPPRFATITSVSAIDSNCLFQGMDLRPKLTPIEAKQNVTTSDLLSSPQKSPQKAQKYKTNRTNPTSSRNELSDIQTKNEEIKLEADEEGIQSLRFSQLGGPIQSETVEPNSRPLTQRPGITHGRSQNIYVSRAGPKAQQAPGQRQYKQPETQRKKFDLLDDIFLPRKVQHRPKVLAEKNSSIRCGKSQVLVLCIRKLFLSRMRNTMNQFSQKARRNSITNKKISLYSLCLTLKVHVQQINLYFFQILKRGNNQFATNLKLIANEKMQLAKKQVHKVVGNKKFLPSILQRILLQNQSRVFIKLKAINQNKKFKNKNIVVCLKNLFKTKIRIFFRGVRRVLAKSKSQKLLGAQILIFYISQRLNGQIKHSFGKLRNNLPNQSKTPEEPIFINQQTTRMVKNISSPNASAMKTSQKSSPSPLSNKLGLQQNNATDDQKATKFEPDKQRLAAISNYQLQVYQLMELNQEWNFQVSYKQNQKDALEKALNSIPQQPYVQTPHSEFSKLSLLTKIYFAVRSSGRDVPVDCLGRGNREQDTLDENGTTWLTLYDNLRYRQQIQAFEQNIRSEEEVKRPENGRRSGWQCGSEEESKVEKIVRDYIKEQYYWLLVRQVVRK